MIDLPLSTYAANVVLPYDYSSILMPQDFPTTQYYPAIASILPAVTNWLNEVQPLLESAAQSSSFPSSLSLGQITGYITTGLSLAQQLDTLNPAPVLFCAEFWDVVTALQQLTVFPELMQP